MITSFHLLLSQAICSLNAEPDCAVNHQTKINDEMKQKQNAAINFASYNARRN